MEVKQAAHHEITVVKDTQFTPMAINTSAPTLMAQDKEKENICMLTAIDMKEHSYPTRNMESAASQVKTKASTSV